MRPGPRTIASAMLLASALSGCCDGSLSEPYVQDLGIHANLRAIAAYDGGDGSLALADGGALVLIGYDDDYERVAELRPVADVELHGVWGDSTAIWVVGDGGFAALSTDLGETWTTVDLDSSADLYAIASVGSRLVVVGDDVVRSQSLDGSWSEPALEDGSWGQLRSLAWDERRIYAVGNHGVIRSAVDPEQTWIREPAGGGQNLHAVSVVWHDGRYHAYAVGDGGTLLARESDGWKRKKTRQSVDLIGFINGLALARDGRVFELRDSGKLDPRGDLPGARALGYSYEAEVAIVGDDGLFALSWSPICFE